MKNEHDSFYKNTRDATTQMSRTALVVPAAFEHITVNTGHSCLQPREAVDAAVSLVLSRMLADALANQGWTDLKPFGKESALHISVAGQALLAHLHAPGHRSRHAKPLVRIGISTTGAEGNDIWTHVRLHAGCVAPSVPANPPAAPWIAASSDITGAFAVSNAQQLFAMPTTMSWAGTSDAASHGVSLLGWSRTVPESSSALQRDIGRVARPRAADKAPSFKLPRSTRRQPTEPRIPPVQSHNSRGSPGRGVTDLPFSS